MSSLEKPYDLQLDRLVKIENKPKIISESPGIMDQFAIGMGADQRLFISIPTPSRVWSGTADLKDNVVVIMNTNKRRELADSKI